MPLHTLVPQPAVLSPTCPRKTRGGSQDPTQTPATPTKSYKGLDRPPKLNASQDEEFTCRSPLPRAHSAGGQPRPPGVGRCPECWGMPREVTRATGDTCLKVPAHPGEAAEPPKPYLTQQLRQLCFTALTATAAKGAVKYRVVTTGPGLVPTVQTPGSACPQLLPLPPTPVLRHPPVLRPPSVPPGSLLSPGGFPSVWDLTM